MLGGGGNGNSTFPVFLEENRFQYDTSSLPQLQLFADVPVGFSVDPVNYSGNQQTAATNHPMKRSREHEPISRQQKPHISLNNNFCQDEVGRSASIFNPNPVSTGLRLSYEEDEHNSSVTSASENMKVANPGLFSVTNSVRMEIDRQKEELCRYISLQGSTKHPIAATIFFGANDAALPGRACERLHVPVEEYKENLRKIVDHLKKCSPTILVVLITPPPLDEEGRFECARYIYGEKAMELPERTNEATGVHAKACVELAKELGLPSINLWSKMQEVEGWQKKFLSDGLHLTPEGNAIVFQEVARVFSESGLSAPNMPNDFPHHSEIDAKNPKKAFRIQCS